MPIFEDVTTEMPDACSLLSPDDKVSQLAVGLVLGYNLALLSVLVTVTVAAAASDTGLEQSQVEELELLLRDWTQELAAQLTTVQMEIDPWTAFLRLSAITIDD